MGRPTSMPLACMQACEAQAAARAHAHAQAQAQGLRSRQRAASVPRLHGLLLRHRSVANAALVLLVLLPSAVAISQ